MWLLAEQVGEILAGCGLVTGPAGAEAELRITLAVDPAGEGIQMGAGSGAVTQVDLRYGLWDSHIRELLTQAGAGSWIRPATPVLRRLWQAFLEYDLLLLKVGLTPGDEALQVIGGQMLTDDNAFFRNRRLAKLRESVVGEPVHAMKEHGIDYVPLNGQIGLLSVGAGETMATMDLLAAAGGQAACFLDCSGGFGPQAVTAALQQISSLPGVRAVLVNIFGGVTRVDGVAESILAALDRLHDHFRLPMVIRLEGNGADRGRDLLARAGLHSHLALRDAVEAVVALTRGEAT